MEAAMPSVRENHNVDSTKRYKQKILSGWMDKKKECIVLVNYFDWVYYFGLQSFISVIFPQ